VILRVLLVLLSIPVAAIAQGATHSLVTGAVSCTPVGPGQRVVDGAFLRPYTRSARQIVTDGAGTVINARSQWRDELLEVQRGGVALLQRIVTMFRFDGGIYAADTVLFRPGTLAPVSTVEWVAGTLVWKRDHAANGLDVSGQRLMVSEGSGVGGAPSDARSFETPVTQPLFDWYGSMDGLIAAAIPHVTGATTCIRSYMPDGDTTGVVSLHVLRAERVEAGAGRFADAYVIQTDDPTGTLRLWVSKLAPFVFKSEQVVLKAGKPWRIYTTLMLESER
jgi:hypothetical protein